MDVDMDNANMPADQPTDWIRVYSDDGFSFLVKRSVLYTSDKLRDSLDSANSYKESRARTCVIQERAVIVEKLIEYMSFKAHYMTRSGKEEIPVNEFLERIPPEIVLELLLAADYHAKRFYKFDFPPILDPVYINGAHLSIPDEGHVRQSFLGRLQYFEIMQ